jgi:hypothetical protein
MSTPRLIALSCALLLVLQGCAVVTVAGAVAGAAVSVGGAVVSTGIKVTGKVVEKTIDAVTPSSE